VGKKKVRLCALRAHLKPIFALRAHPTLISMVLGVPLEHEWLVPWTSWGRDLRFICYEKFRSAQAGKPVPPILFMVYGWTGGSWPTATNFQFLVFWQRFFFHAANLIKESELACRAAMRAVMALDPLAVG